LSLATSGAAPRPPPDLVPVRFREVGGDVLLTNPWGDWVFVSKDEFGALFRGEPPAGALRDRLAERSFLASGVDPARIFERARYRRRFPDYGPNLHILIVTLRCNETCVYCHASRADMDAVQTDMTPEIAEKAVDLMLQSTSPSVTLEFQGGEPLVNF